MIVPSRTLYWFEPHPISTTGTITHRGYAKGGSASDLWCIEHELKMYYFAK
jgi:hypothetical protein